MGGSAKTSLLFPFAFLECFVLVAGVPLLSAFTGSETCFLKSLEPFPFWASVSLPSSNPSLLLLAARLDAAFLCDLFLRVAAGFSWSTSVSLSSLVSFLQFGFFEVFALLGLEVLWVGARLLLLLGKKPTSSSPFAAGSSLSSSSRPCKLCSGYQSVSSSSSVLWATWFAFLFLDTVALAALPLAFAFAFGLGDAFALALLLQVAVALALALHLGAAFALDLGLLDLVGGRPLLFGFAAVTVAFCSAGDMLSVVSTSFSTGSLAKVVASLGLGSVGVVTVPFLLDFASCFAASLVSASVPRYCVVLPSCWRWYWVLKTSADLSPSAGGGGDVFSAYQKKKRTVNQRKLSQTSWAADSKQRN